MTVPFSAVKPQSLKMKVVPVLSKVLQAGAGVAVSSTATQATVGVDFTNVAHISVPALTGVYFVTWDDSAKVVTVTLGDGLFTAAANYALASSVSAIYALYPNHL